MTEKDFYVLTPSKLMFVYWSRKRDTFVSLFKVLSLLFFCTVPSHPRFSAVER